MDISGTWTDVSNQARYTFKNEGNNYIGKYESASYEYMGKKKKSMTIFTIAKDYLTQGPIHLHNGDKTNKEFDLDKGTNEERNWKMQFYIFGDMMVVYIYNHEQGNTHHFVQYLIKED